MGKEHIDSEKECLVDLDSKRYIYIDNEDDEIIERLCEAIFRSVVLDNISEPEEIEDRVEEDKQGDFDVPFSGSIIDSETVKKHTESLATLLKNIKRPYMIIQESHYIDSGFRDRYYSYYSNQHFDMHRYSRRLSFFYLSEEFTEDIRNNIDEYFIK